MMSRTNTTGPRGLLILIGTLLAMPILAQQNAEPCAFDAYTNNKSIQAAEQIIKARLQTKLHEAAPDSIRYIPVVVHIIHDGGTENISLAQVESQIQILNEDYGKLPGTNGDGNGVDTKVRFCLAKIDPNGNCTNGIVRIRSTLTNHQTYQRALLKELSAWDNTRYMNIYLVKNINGNVGGYSSFPGGPPNEDGMVVRHNLFGNMGTSNGLGRTTSHEIGHWFGLYHTFNNGCGVDVCSDGDYVCDTPPQASPSFGCNTLNTCSNDNPDLNDLKENYMNYTPDNCQNMLTQGQKERMHATLDTIRTYIWSEANLISTGCDTAYVAPAQCPVAANFVTLTPDVCVGNSIYFMDISLNDATSWQWSFPGGTPSTSTDQNPTITYNSVGSYPVSLVSSDGNSTDSLTVIDFISVSLPGIGDPLYYAENFDAGLYPPAGITINNADGGITWELDSLGFTSAPYSFKINNLINTNYGSSDEIELPYFDLTSIHVDSLISMTFKWAYAKSDPSFSDEMIVLLSTDCGTNFDQIFYKTGGGLITGPTQTTPFIPDSSQWKFADIDLEDYENETYVLIKIVNVTDGGNNLYVDDIYIGDGSGITAIEELEEAIEDLSLFPNPANANSTLEYTLKVASRIEISINNMQGQTINTIMQGKKSEGVHRIELPTQALANGVYFVKLLSDKGHKTIKLMVNN